MAVTAIKVGSVVTVPERDSLKEWSGRPGVVVDIPRRGHYKGKIIVLVTSAVDDLRASRFVFDRDELTAGGDVSDSVHKSAGCYIETVEQWARDMETIRRSLARVEEYVEKLVRKGVKLGSASETAKLKTDNGWYYNTVYYTTFLYRGKEIGRIPKRDYTFYDDYVAKVYEKTFGEAGNDVRN